MLAIVRAPVHSNYSKGRNLIKKAVATALVIKIMTPNATQSSSSKTESDYTLDDVKDNDKTKTYCKIYVLHRTEENIFFCNAANDQNTLK